MIRGEWEQVDPYITPRAPSWFERLTGTAPRDPNWLRDKTERLIGEDGVVVAYLHPNGSGGFYGVIEVPCHQMTNNYATIASARLAVEERLAHLCEPHPQGYFWCKVCRGPS